MGRRGLKLFTTGWHERASSLTVSQLLQLWERFYWLILDLKLRTAFRKFAVLLRIHRNHLLRVRILLHRFRCKKLCSNQHRALRWQCGCGCGFRLCYVGARQHFGQGNLLNMFFFSSSTKPRFRFDFLLTIFLATSFLVSWLTVEDSLQHRKYLLPSTLNSTSITTQIPPTFELLPLVVRCPASALSALSSLQALFLLTFLSFGT